MKFAWQHPPPAASIGFSWRIARLEVQSTLWCKAWAQRNLENLKAHKHLLEMRNGEDICLDLSVMLPYCWMACRWKLMKHINAEPAEPGHLVKELVSFEAILRWPGAMAPQRLCFWCLISLSVSLQSICPLIRFETCQRLGKQHVERSMQHFDRGNQGSTHPVLPSIVNAFHFFFGWNSSRLELRRWVWNKDPIVNHDQILPSVSLLQLSSISLIISLVWCNLPFFIALQTFSDRTYHCSNSPNLAASHEGSFIEMRCPNWFDGHSRGTLGTRHTFSEFICT